MGSISVRFGAGFRGLEDAGPAHASRSVPGGCTARYLAVSRAWLSQNGRGGRALAVWPMRAPLVLEINDWGRLQLASDCTSVAGYT
jgi:hypothetical protein